MFENPFFSEGAWLFAILFSLIGLMALTACGGMVVGSVESDKIFAKLGLFPVGVFALGFACWLIWAAPWDVSLNAKLLSALVMYLVEVFGSLALGVWLGKRFPN